MSKINFKKFSDMSYEAFRQKAKDSDLSIYEKIGFPNTYRADFEKNIFLNIKDKLLLDDENKTIIDIGCGCSEIPYMLASLSKNKKHRLVLCDSKEMFSNIPDIKAYDKIEGRFPLNIEKFEKYMHKADAVIVYSVLHSVIADANIYEFIDNLLELLADGGRLFLADIPNLSKRNRFFSSNNGKKFHKKFMNTSKDPEIELLKIPHGHIDDGIIFSILQRYRNAGFDTYIFPQPNSLPMANRREDILIIKP